jgi:hypothetical protein
MNGVSRITALVISTGWLLACSTSEPAQTSIDMPMAQPPAGGAASPAPGGPPATGAPAATAGSSAAPSASAGAPSTVPEPPGMEPAAPDPDPMAGGTEPRFPDACAERRASWHVPCHDDPDPCGLNSGYEGDEYCLLPPPEGKGVQIHFGPKNYDDPAEVEKFVLEPGEEFNSYGVVHIPTTEERWYNYVKLSMRPGSHHVINQVIQGQPAEGFTTGGQTCDATTVGGFTGTQTLILESPPQGIPAPENEGLGRSLPGNASLCQNYHRYNFTDQPQLSEIWYNVWFVEEADITQRSSGVTVFAGPYAGIAPGAREIVTRTTTVDGDGRIISLFGHRHAATERFAVWLNEDLVYDSWDWVESRVFNYDSVTENPPPAPEAMTDGAVSGILEVKTGDAIKVECHVNNTTDQTLTFRNELYTGEMCILFGSSVGTNIR